MIICKIAESASCPKKLNICCCTCDQNQHCDMACDTVFTHNCDHTICPEAEECPDQLTTFQTAVPEAITQITQIIIQQKQLEEQSKQLKVALVEAMEQYGVKKWENDQISMTYVAPTTRSSIDSTKLKKDHPEIWEAYQKTSKVSASVRVVVK